MTATAACLAVLSRQPVRRRARVRVRVVSLAGQPVFQRDS
jgi:hypothetical protein